MKQYIKFLKFLWVLFIVPAVGGMVINPDLKYGMTQDMIYKSIEPIKKVAVKKSLGLENIDSSEIENVLGEVNCEFEWITNHHMNILFYEGDAYLSGFLNNYLDINELEVRGKKYRIKQLHNVLEVTNEEMDAINDIYEEFPLLETTIKYNQRKKGTKKGFSIDEFWDKSKELSDKELEDILKTLDEKGSDEELEFYDKTYPQKSYEYLKATINYILSSRVLKVADIKNMKFNEQELLKSVEKAKEKLHELLKGIGNYIKEFDEVFNTKKGELFLEEVEKLENLEDPLII